MTKESPERESLLDKKTISRRNFLRGVFGSAAAGAVGGAWGWGEVKKVANFFESFNYPEGLVPATSLEIVEGGKEAFLEMADGLVEFSSPDGHVGMGVVVQRPTTTGETVRAILTADHNLDVENLRVNPREHTIDSEIGFNHLKGEEIRESFWVRGEEDTDLAALPLGLIYKIAESSYPLTEKQKRAFDLRQIDTRPLEAGETLLFFHHAIESNKTVVKPDTLQVVLDESNNALVDCLEASSPGDSGIPVFRAYKNSEGDFEFRLAGMVVQSREEGFGLRVLSGRQIYDWLQKNAAELDSRLQIQACIGPAKIAA